MPVHSTKNLRERRLGDLEGKMKEEVSPQSRGSCPYPAQARSIHTTHLQGQRHFAAPAGKSHPGAGAASKGLCVWGMRHQRQQPDIHSQVKPFFTTQHASGAVYQVGDQFTETRYYQKTAIGRD